MPAVVFLATILVVLALPELPDPGRLWPALLLQPLWAVPRYRSAAAIAAGLLLVVIAGQLRLRDDWSCARDREPHEVTGRIAEPPARRARSTRFLLDTGVDSTRGRLPRRVLVHWYGEAPALVAGETWRLRLRLRCRHGWRNPGGFDRELDLLRRGIGATATVMREGGTRLAPPDARQTVDSLRQRIAARIATSVAEPRVQGLVQGLAVGLRAEIPADVWRAFVATGTVHLLAISGMHVTSFAAWLVAGVAALYRLPLPPRLGRSRLSLTIVVMGAGTGAYALLAGASVPTLRTFAGVALLLALRALRRHARPGSWLLATAVVIAATDPLALATPGFWLSFLAVAALLALPAAPERGMLLRVFGLLRAQAAVTLGLAVPLALFFGSLSWVAPIANLAAVPFFGGVVLPPVLAGVACTTLGLGLDAVAYRLAGHLLEAILPLLEWLAGFGAALRHLAPLPLAALAGAGALFALALWLPLATLRGLALIAGLALIGARDVRPPAGAAELVLFDVGQGLAAAVLTRNHAMLFDAGPAFMGDSSAAAQTVVPYLATRQVRRLDVLVVSHPDADHAGGAAAVREAFAPHRVLAGGTPRAAGASACRQGQRWWHDGVRFEVLHPPPGADLDDNDGSCVLAVQTGAARALLTADIGARIETMAADRWAGPADVVLVPHHGSRHSSAATFVDATRPRLALVSAGFGNRWGMPADRVVAAWRGAGATLLRTDRDGAIRVRLGATPPAVEATTEREVARRWWQASPW
ncbi:MAG: DNA internalization-related competence protein ComEC/Rec2 [Gammaproteobacteria bacterium]|nr:DNA internalization-related competence protein ComEC/Rec2 [Gammaproteobacteria bacterium]